MTLRPDPKELAARARADLRMGVPVVLGREGGGGAGGRGRDPAAPTGSPSLRAAWDAACWRSRRAGPRR